jgi:hypothetical protein
MSIFSQRIYRVRRIFGQKICASPIGEDRRRDRSRQSNSIRSAARCCLTVGDESSSCSYLILQRTKSVTKTYEFA